MTQFAWKQFKLSNILLADKLRLPYSGLFFRYHVYHANQRFAVQSFVSSPHQLSFTIPFSFANWSCYCLSNFIMDRRGWMRWAVKSQMSTFGLLFAQAACSSCFVGIPHYYRAKQWAKRISGLNGAFHFARFQIAVSCMLTKGFLSRLLGCSDFGQSRVDCRTWSAARAIGYR